MSSRRRLVRGMLFSGIFWNCLAVAAVQNALLELEMFLKTCTNNIRCYSSHAHARIRSGAHLTFKHMIEIKQRDPHACTRSQASTRISIVHVHVTCMMHHTRCIIETSRAMEEKDPMHHMHPEPDHKVCKHIRPCIYRGKTAMKYISILLPQKDTTSSV